MNDLREGISLREGDIYKWYYKNDAEYRQKSPSTAYWCMDNMAVVHNGNLIDTYWLYMDKERIVESSSCHYVGVDKVDLGFVCNLNDVRFIDKWQIDDYDKVYDLSRQKRCYPLYAVDKDAQVSDKALRTKYEKLLYDAYSEKRSAEYIIEYYSKLIEELGE